MCECVKIKAMTRKKKTHPQCTYIFWFPFGTSINSCNVFYPSIIFFMLLLSMSTKKLSLTLLFSHIHMYTFVLHLTRFFFLFKHSLPSIHIFIVLRLSFFPSCHLAQVHPPFHPYKHEFSNVSDTSNCTQDSEPYKLFEVY